MKTYLKSKIGVIILFIISGALIAGCKKDDVSIDIPKKEIDREVSLRGYMEKGPFITGTRVTIYEVDNTFKQTGRSYTTEIDNDFGHFQVSGKFNTPYAQISASGYYFNEITGKLSNSTLNLKSIIPLAEENNTNINVLTSLAHDRILYLINSGQYSYQNAKLEAEKEVLAIFNLEPATIPFESLDIHMANEDNAKLLAVSAILQANNTEAQLSELLSKISIDIKEDGVLNDQQILTNLKLNVADLNLLKIRENLENRYRSLGIEYSIPPFEKFSKALMFIPQDKIIKDPNTQLIWLVTAPSEKLELKDAIKFCEALEVGEYKDWRLATIEELSQIYPYKDALISNSTAENYWSSTFSHKGSWQGVIYDNYKTIDFRDGHISAFYGGKFRFLPVHD
ncbi:Lcl C-terminal domain-containing protein [Pontibacter chinhatensis]|uniref:Lcl C-terminal domain-containing protein n=1 Tax=Pontibacter chinhatensis TaxID=1436961 RepID=A0A1I2XM43_9BACT|nr:DUF1566 domain-containing protein [Pontibacter chinhatensis]SFH14530.1 Protein of unknown function [Pontibacter chinhatensis]